MQRFVLFTFVILNLVYFNGMVFSHPQPPEEDFSSYATLYPEIAKKIGEEPIEIIDVVKSVVVYDSDDAAAAEATTASPDPESETVNAPIPGESFLRSRKSKIIN